MGPQLSEAPVRTVAKALVVLCTLALAGPRLVAQASKPPASHSQTTPIPTQPDSVTLRIVSTELRTAVQILQQYLDRPVILSGAAATMLVSLETPHPVPRADVPRLLRGLLESQNYELLED